MAVYHALSGSAAEDLFIDLFSEGFGFLFPREWVEILQRKEPLQIADIVCFFVRIYPLEGLSFL